MLLQELPVRCAVFIPFMHAMYRQLYNFFRLLVVAGCYG